LVPITERAAALLVDPHMAAWCEPHRWPEVVRVAETLGELTKQPPRLGQWGRDFGVQAVVQAFAAGFTPDDVCRLLPDIVASSWWAKSKRGLSSLSLEVLRRAEATASPEQAGGGIMLSEREANLYS
jgi:hypothetical protein